jgi:carboxylesterase type B
MEGYDFSNQSLRSQDDLLADLQQLFPTASSVFFFELVTLYPAQDYAETFYRRQDIFADFIINCPSRWISEATTKKNRQSWKMIFNTGRKTHGADSEFVYDDRYEQKSGANVRLAKMMKDWFISFMTDHNPNTKSWSEVDNNSKLNWPSYGTDHSTLVINDSGTEVKEDAEVGVKCDFWKRYPDVTLNKRRKRA